MESNINKSKHNKNNSLNGIIRQSKHLQKIIGGSSVNNNKTSESENLDIKDDKII
jgi:phosphotransferase system IIB component